MSTVDERERIIFIVAGIIMIVLILTFFLIVRGQYSQLNPATYRQSVLSTRCAFCLPFYGIFLFISVIRPESFEALEIPISIFEGYSFYCFLNLMVENLGGPSETVKILQETPAICCPCTGCCHEDKAKFYHNCTWAQWHFLWTRSIFVIISGIASYSKHKGAKIIFVLFAFLAFILLVRGVLYVVNFFENVYSKMVNLRGISKFLVMKMSVGLMVIQTLVTSVVVALNKVTLPPSTHFTADERAESVVCFIILCEYLLLNIVAYISFSSPITSPPHTSHSAKFSPSPPSISLCGYLCDVFSFWDIHNVLTVQEGEGQSLTQAKV